MRTLRLSLLILALLAACAPKTPVVGAQTPTQESFQFPATWTPEPTILESYTPASVLTLAPTWMPEPSYTLPASLTPIPTKDSSATPIFGYCAQTETACEIATAPSKRRGWCQMTAAAAGTSTGASCGLIYDYSLLYPKEWVIDTVGVLRPNLLFNTGTGNSEVRLLQLVAGELTLDNADQAVICNDTGDCLPVVGADESIIGRRTRVYAERDFLFLISSLADTLITRYFLFREHPTTEIRLYIIEIRLPEILIDSEEYNLLLDQTEVLLGSIQPETTVEVTPIVPSKTPTITPSPTLDATLEPTSDITLDPSPTP